MWFPVGTTGYQIDVVARASLWRAGLEYRHGTGHGVGSHLNVHEGPQGIGYRPAFNLSPLSAGMTITNEPGYYKENAYGIRIENIMLVVPAAPGFNKFEHVTFVPIQTKLMDFALMNGEEIAWVNQYHVDCRRHIAPLLSGEPLALKWLLRETELI